MILSAVKLPDEAVHELGLTVSESCVTCSINKAMLEYREVPDHAELERRAREIAQVVDEAIDAESNDDNGVDDKGVLIAAPPFINGFLLESLKSRGIDLYYPMLINKRIEMFKAS